MPFKQPLSVLVVIHTPALDVLLLERASHPGYWQSVTGSREDDENLADTAKREVYEETGIIADADALYDWQQVNRFEIFAQWRDRYAPGISHNSEHVFSLAVPAATAVITAPREHLSHRWLNWREAAEQVFSWSNRDAILALPDHLARRSR